MTRPTRLVLMLGSLLSFTAAAPAPTQAGLIPWAYNAIFGPVGSMRYRTAYAPMYGGYGNGGYGSYGGYAPMSYGSYAPMSYASTTAYGSSGMPSYGGGGCNSCNQSSYYAPYTQSVGSDGFYGGYPSSAYVTPACNSCGSGNSSVGSNCTNCNANMAPLPSGSGVGTSSVGTSSSNFGPSPISAPIPDPNNTRDVNTRLLEMENRINRDEHRWKEIEKFLKSFHKNEYQPAPFSGTSTYGETVPARRHQTFDSGNTADPDAYPPPLRRNNPAPTGDPIEEGVRKPDLNLSVPPFDEKPRGQEKEESTTFKESELQTLRLQERITTQAVAPRERMMIVTRQSKTAIAKSNKPVTKTSEQSGSPSLARN